MLYVSTRGAAPSLDFEHVLLSGLAQDGGLYVPKNWPKFTKDDLEKFRDLSYSDLAFQIIKPFVGQTIEDTNLKGILSEVYSSFSHPEVAPLKPLTPNLYFFSQSSMVALRESVISTFPLRRSLPYLGI